MHPSIKQLRKTVEELCLVWTGHRAVFVHPTKEESEDEEWQEMPQTFTVFDTSNAYHIKWPYLEVKFVLTYQPKLHLLILGNHRNVMGLLANIDGLYIDGLTRADILSLETPVVMAVPLNSAINRIENGYGGVMFTFDGSSITYSFDNANKMSIDKRNGLILDEPIVKTMKSSKRKNYVGCNM